MKLYRFFLMLIFACISQLAISQNYVATEKALEIIEIKQAEVDKSFKEGNLNKLTKDMYNYFFEITLIYLRDGSDIPETLSISFEKCLNRFENNQEDVVVVKDDISKLLTL